MGGGTWYYIGMSNFQPPKPTSRTRTTGLVKCIQKAGRRPYYRMRYGGKEYYLGMNIVEAYRKAEEIIGPAVQVREAPERVADLIRYWREQHDKPMDLWQTNVWAKFAGQRRLADLDRNHLERFAQHLQSTTYLHTNAKQRQPRKYSPAYMRKCVQCAKRLLDWAYDQEWLARTPPKKPKMPPVVRRPRDVPPDVLRKAFETLPPRSGRVLRFILETGCRPSEATTLTWENVDLDRDVCVLGEGEHKTSHHGKTRTIYLTPEAKRILEQTDPEYREGVVFINRWGKGFDVGTLRNILRARGITGAYQLRHTFAQNALEQVSVEDVAKLLGHSNLQTVQVYCQVRDQRARQVAKALVSPLPRPPISPTPETSAGEGSTELQRKIG